MERPRGVTLIAAVFFAAAGYLFALGVVRLANPGLFSLSWGAPLLHGLELAGPYAFLLTSAVAALIAFGLLRLKNIARRAAIVVCAVGIVMLIPKVSAAASDISVKFFVSGSMIAFRMMMIWYLWQSWTAEKFR